MSPPNNATSTTWKYFEKSIRDRTIIPTDKDGNAVDPEPVLEYLRSLGATPSSFPTTLQMEFQVLPKSRTKNNLKADNCVSVQVARIPLKVELFDGKDAAGPVPILFASDQAAAFVGLMDNAGATLEDIHKLNSRFIFFDHLTMENAVTYLQGNARKAKGVPAYALQKGFDNPTAKKAKTVTAPVRSSSKESNGKLCSTTLMISYVDVPQNMDINHKIDI
jgi:hypothetical protein